jgi:hypothetical protein
MAIEILKKQKENIKNIAEYSIGASFTEARSLDHQTEIVFRKP